jgi:hypothetical protein
MTRRLEPLDLNETVDMYLKERSAELGENSHLNSLTERDLHRHRHWRSKQVNPVALKPHFATPRVFLEFCAQVNGVEEGMREKVMLAVNKHGGNARNWCPRCGYTWLPVRRSTCRPGCHHHQPVMWGSQR